MSKNNKSFVKQEWNNRLTKKEISEEEKYRNMLKEKVNK